MTISISQAKKLRRLFGWGFVLSLIVFLWYVFYVNKIDMAPASPTGSGASGHPADVLVVYASLLSSCVTFVGFVFTTTIAWRKERREKMNADVELEKKKLEIEKLRLELEKAKEKR